MKPFTLNPPTSRGLSLIGKRAPVATLMCGVPSAATCSGRGLAVIARIAGRCDHVREIGKTCFTIVLYGLKEARTILTNVKVEPLV